MESISDALIYWTIITGIIVLCIFGIYRMVLSYERKNRLQFWFVSIFLGGIVLFILFANELLPGSKMYYDYRYSKSVTGRSMTLHNVFTYESYIDPFLGDGYALYLYKFDETSSCYFQNPPESFFTHAPYNTNHGTNWLRKNWTDCPIDSEDLRFAKFALGKSYFHQEEEDLANAHGEITRIFVEQRKPVSQFTELDKVRSVVANLLKEEGNYYAYSSNDNPIWNITFYVLAPKDGWLIAIHNDM